jgi:cytochrome c556
MMRRVLNSMMVVAGLCLVGAGAAAQSPGADGGVKAIGSIKELMQTLTIPMSETVFKAAAEPPADAKAWEHVRSDALALAESANLLLIAGRVPDAHGWSRFAIAQRDAAVQAMKAAEAKNADALSNASDALYDTCSSCHDVYMKK